MMAQINDGSYIDGTYLVKGVLGSGGSSTVYAAFDRDLNRELAIKVLHFAGNDDAALARIKREARILNQLSHKNIVKVFRIGFIDECSPYIVMERVCGRSLRQVLDQEKNFSCDRAIAIALQISSAMAYAHSMNVIHRDLKPENVVFDEEFSDELRIRIIDFGLSRSLLATSKLTETGSMLGTVPYMSPEQCLGKELDGSTDIYSFGCLLFEMLSGSPPFPADSLDAVVIHHLSSPFPKIRDLDPSCSPPDALQELLLKCTAKAKEDRYSSFGEITQALAEIDSLHCQTRLDLNRISRSAAKKAQRTSAWTLKVMIPLALLLSFLVCLFLVETEKGSLILCEAVQRNCSMELSAETFLRLAEHFALTGRQAEALRISSAMLDSPVFAGFSEELRCRTIEKLLGIFEQLPSGKELFFIKLQALEIIIKVGRTSDAQLKLSKHSKQFLNKICDQLLNSEHSREDWLKIVRAIQHATQDGKYAQPSWRIQPLLFIARVESGAQQPDTAEFLKSAYSAISSAANDGDRQLLERVADKGFQIAEKTKSYESAVAFHCFVGHHYFSRGDLSRANRELSLAEKLAAKTYFLAEREEKQLESLRLSCKTGHFVPAAPINVNKITKDKEYYEEFVHRSGM